MATSKKVTNPWDVPVTSPTPPNMEKKSSKAQIKKVITTWKPKATSEKTNWANPNVISRM